LDREIRKRVKVSSRAEERTLDLDKKAERSSLLEKKGIDRESTPYMKLRKEHEEKTEGKRKRSLPQPSRYSWGAFSIGEKCARYLAQESRGKKGKG